MGRWDGVPRGITQKGLAIEVLLDAGLTMEPTRKTVVELAAGSGRVRFRKPDTSLRVSVGKNTTIFYEVIAQEMKHEVRINTKALWAIRELAALSDGPGLTAWLRAIPGTEKADRQPDMWPPARPNRRRQFVGSYDYDDY